MARERDVTVPGSEKAQKRDKGFGEVEKLRLNGQGPQRDGSP